MSTLRDVSLELARMERAMKAKEAEYFQEKARPLIYIMYTMMKDNPEFCERIMKFNREDVRVIVNWMMKNFDTILEGAKPELDDVRAKREKRTARRRESQKLKEQEAEAAKQAQFNAIFNDTYKDVDDDDESWRRETSYDTEEYPDELRQIHNQQYGSGNYQG